MKKSKVRRVQAGLVLLLALFLGLPARGEPESAPASSSSTATSITLARPGSQAAAIHDPRVRFTDPKLGGVFVQSPGGLLLPDRRLTLSTAKERTDQARWRGVRRAVFRHLERSGARLSPAPYQQMVKKIRNRAELAMRREGKSLGSWKMMVVEGGAADRVNAAAWTGGVITIYRPLVDLCFQIANVAVNAGSPTKLDTELWRLSRWRRDKRSLAPEGLKVSPDKVAKRDILAESILSRVVLHEMGHAANGHLELKDRKLIIPGQHKPEDLIESRAQERAADLFSATLGTKGAVRVPGVMPLFSYYNFISRPTFSERGKGELDWRTHPIDADRYNSQREVVSSAGRAKGLPQPLERRIILPNGEYATPTKPAEVVPIRPPARTPVPLQKAADRPTL